MPARTRRPQGVGPPDRSECAASHVLSGCPAWDDRSAMSVSSHQAMPSAREGRLLASHRIKAMEWPCGFRSSSGGRPVDEPVPSQRPSPREGPTRAPFAVRWKRSSVLRENDSAGTTQCDARPPAKTLAMTSHDNRPEASLQHTTVGGAPISRATRNASCAWCKDFSCAPTCSHRRAHLQSLCLWGTAQA